MPAGLCTRLVPGGNLNTAYQTKLNGYVQHLQSLQHNGQPMPFLLRPFHEADSGWFWRGTVGCTDTQFKALFRYTVQYLRNAGLKHMLVVYAPGAFTNKAQYLARYPGDDVVDVIAMDQYLKGSADPNHGTSAAALVNQLRVVHELAQERGKIAAWAETGQKSLPSNEAFTQIRQIVRNSGIKLAYMMFWANYEPSQFYVPHSGSPQALKTNFNQFLTPPMVTAGQYPSLYP